MGLHLLELCNGGGVTSPPLPRLPLLQSISAIDFVVAIEQGNGLANFVLAAEMVLPEDAEQLFGGGVIEDGPVAGAIEAFVEQCSVEVGVVFGELSGPGVQPGFVGVVGVENL